MGIESGGSGGSERRRGGRGSERTRRFSIGDDRPFGDDRTFGTLWDNSQQHARRRNGDVFDASPFPSSVLVIRRRSAGDWPAARAALRLSRRGGGGDPLPRGGVSRSAPPRATSSARSAARRASRTRPEAARAASSAACGRRTRRTRVGATGAHADRPSGSDREQMYRLHTRGVRVLAVLARGRFRYRVRPRARRDALALVQPLAATSSCGVAPRAAAPRPAAERDGFRG